MAILFSDEVELVFTKLFEQLQKKGVLPEMSPDEKKQIIKTVTDKMEEENLQLDGNDLLNPEVTKKLQMTLVAAFVQKNDPSFQFQLSALFKKNAELTPEEKLELQDEMKNTIEEMAQLKPGVIRDALTAKLKLCMQELRDGNLDKESIEELQIYLLMLSQQLSKMKLGAEDSVITSMLERAKEHTNKELVSAGGDKIMDLNDTTLEKSGAVGLENVLASALDKNLIEILCEENIIKPGFETPTFKPWSEAK